MNLGEGTILNNRYQILRVLSDKGGMGVIYQAHDQNLNDTVVIKQSRFTESELQRQYPGWPAERVRSQAEFLRKAFEREAKLLFGLRHNALPRVLDYFAKPDGNQFFVMEFIPGKDFGELLNERLAQNQGPFPLEQVLAWAEQMLDVLDYLHTHFDPPIIHRDIKPQNLKLMPNGQVILLDFGLAKGARLGMSVVESIHGHTPHYAPLEQVNRKVGQEQPTDPRSDIYSLAITLLHLLTGKLPPDAVDRVQAVAQGEVDPLRPAHELVPTISATVSVALQRAATVFAKDRLATVEELRQLLHEGVTPAPPTIIAPQLETEPPTIVQPKPLVTEAKLAQPQSFSEDLGNGTKLEMIYIPGGSFLMGSPDGVGFDNEHPQHRVTLSPFFIGKYPITQAQWQAVMGADPSEVIKGDDLAVHNVTWYSARKFCKAISKQTGNSYRLPTEAEWEYACRAGSTSKYYYGDDQYLLEEYAWHRENNNEDALGGYPSAHPVGQKEPNAWGLYDMHGLIEEWCQDWYGKDYYAQSPETDPQGPESGEFRLLRGGSWISESIYCRSAYRSWHLPEGTNVSLGVRIVCVAQAR